MLAQGKPENAPIRLTELAPGESGRLLAPAYAGNLDQRLADLGFVTGTHVRLVRHAPLGDPIELEIRGYRICLRREQIEDLRVVRESA